MNARKFTPLALAALVAAGTVSGVALAKETDHEKADAAALASAKVSLSQAIATAEQKSGGKAVGAGVDHEKGAVRIAVEVVGGHGVQTVLVDPQSGQVTATHNGGEHEDEGDETD